MLLVKNLSKFTACFMVDCKREMLQLANLFVLDFITKIVLIY